MNINEIKADLQLIGTKIAKLNIENDFVYFDQNDTLTREIDVSYDLSDAYKLGETEAFLVGNIMMYINVRIGNTMQKTELALELEGCFQLNCLDESKLKEMLSVNGTAALYSIARGIVSSVSSHMCSNGTIILPMINVFRLRNGMEEGILTGEERDK